MTTCYKHATCRFTYMYNVHGVQAEFYIFFCLDMVGKALLQCVSGLSLLTRGIKKKLILIKLIVIINHQTQQRIYSFLILWSIIYNIPYFISSDCLKQYFNFNYQNHAQNILDPS